MKIRELSRRTGVSARMLRYYEEQGLLKPDRTSAGYRHYSNQDVVAVERIVLLNQVGMTLGQIRPLLTCSLRGEGNAKPCAALQDRIRQNILQLDRDMERLLETKTLLEGYLGD